nr:MAG TPA: hypothetical protein [Caudoviricetes sp.]
MIIIFSAHALETHLAIWHSRLLLLFLFIFLFYFLMQRYE